MIFAANLKCNHTRKSFSEYLDFLDKNLDDKIYKTNQIFIFPPQTAFLENSFKFIQGTQNFYPEFSGSFTGEIGKEMLDEFGINLALIGHSERREILGEDDDFLKTKFDFAKKFGFKVIYCIGESDVCRMNGSTEEFLSQELKFIDLDYENLILAYEPIWAIGTGKSAKIDEISEVLNFLRKKTKVPLLYGGSVNESNIVEISKIQNCDGVLVGTASWDAKKFLNLINLTM